LFDNRLEPSDIKDKIIDAALCHIPFDGWTQKSLKAGAKDIGIDINLIDSLFSNNSIDLLQYHSNLSDRRMKHAINELNLEEMKIRERIAASIRIRLGALDLHKEAIKSGVTLLSKPSNTLSSLNMLYETVDGIWFSIGDSSTDFNFYTKRFLLSNVYISTLLYWLNDKSEGSCETWNFLERRINEVLKIQKLKSEVVSKTSAASDLMTRIREGVSNQPWSRKTY
tara:strand:- start:6181 stop:6855 length:675 start_codon:yes stop_codon:yes gene_type:complete